MNFLRSKTLPKFVALARLGYIYILVISISTLVACGENEEPKAGAVAQVGDKYLYESELISMIPQGLLETDSIAQTEKYIEKWILQQLILQKAEKYLKKESDEIERKVESFRTSLLIHEYKQKFLAQKLDTVVTHAQSLEYYEQYKQDFILKKAAVKCYFIKISKNKPEVEQLKSLIRSMEIGAENNIRKTAKENADYFYDYSNEWKYLSEIIQLTNYSFSTSNESSFLRTQNYIEASDQKYFYFVKILDYKLKDNIAPHTLAKKEIRTIILNRRSTLMLQELERTIRDNAEKNDEVKIF